LASAGQVQLSPKPNGVSAMRVVEDAGATAEEQVRDTLALRRLGTSTDDILLSVAFNLRLLVDDGDPLRGGLPPCIKSDHHLGASAMSGRRKRVKSSLSRTRRPKSAALNDFRCSSSARLGREDRCHNCELAP